MNKDKFINYEQAKKEVHKLISWFTPKYRTYQVFKDFITLAACTISNSVDKSQWQKREDLYLQTIKKYDKKEANKFAEMLGLVVLGLENGLGDFLGELYMSLEISNAESGQFFTPFDISSMMAEFLDYEPVDGIITLNEPAAGSGGMIIAYAASMHSRGLNFQEQLRVVCNDIDHDVVKMCYIQLSLVGIDAVVMQGNTITAEMNEVWYTPMHLINKAKKSYEKLQVIEIYAKGENKELVKKENRKWSHERDLLLIKGD